MLSFISIIKCNGITDTYHVALSHQNQYNAELISKTPLTDSLPQKLSINKYKLAQSVSGPDLVTSKIASAILLAENNQEGFS